MEETFSIDIKWIVNIYSKKLRRYGHKGRRKREEEKTWGKEEERGGKNHSVSYQWNIKYYSSFIHSIFNSGSIKIYVDHKNDISCSHSI